MSAGDVFGHGSKFLVLLGEEDGSGRVLGVPLLPTTRSGDRFVQGFDQSCILDSSDYPPLGDDGEVYVRYSLMRKSPMSVVRQAMFEQDPLPWPALEKVLVGAMAPLGHAPREFVPEISALLRSTS